MDERGQGALEYMLMIALSLAVIAAMLTIFPGKPSESAQKARRAFNITNESIEGILEEAT